MLSLLTLLCAVSCDGEKDPEGSSGSLPKESMTAPMGQSDDIVIASNGNTEFTVWIAQELYSNESIKSKLNSVRDQIKKKTGATLAVKSDRTATEVDKEKPGILVGATSFAESDSITLGVRNKDFAVTRVGNKILLYAKSAEGAFNAVSNFYNKVVATQKTENRTLRFTKNHEYVSSYTYPIQSVLCCGTELVDYGIVVPKNASVNETNLANNLRYYLNENYGYKFEIVTDDKTPAEYEILIGNTRRTTAQTSKNQFTVTASGGKLQLLADGMLGYESLWSHIQTTLMPTGQGKIHTLADGFAHTADATTALSDGTFFATQNTGDARVIFYNIYGWDEAGGPTVRQPIQKELIAAYAPDVLGLQEYAESYHTGFTAMLKELGYTEISTTAGTQNYTPLFYKADKLEVVQSGYRLYAGPNDSDSKGVTWAVFRVKSTGKLFAVFNTHFMYNQEGIDGNAARVSNAQEILAIIQTVQNQYEGISVVMGGDLNSAANSNPHKVLTNGGLVHAWNKTETKNNTSGYHTYSTYDAEWKIYSEVTQISGNRNNAIDHAYVSAGAAVMGYASLCNDYALWTSDHMPILVDLKL